MSGNASRKYKQYRLMQERKQLFGDVKVLNEFGKVDFVAFSASQGRVITSSPKLSLEKMIIKMNK
ncbi:hypothetical protein [Caloramator proteoclasticus]|uniref:Uncharacterized protein n=1 Tax=Caloramator proteoclasticus DSM 10124 TaxID=1121262 RepID=A0A1M4X7P3_9CLOT|nr:hypothetical protein [Caloramator proteoclasticus]SHE89506.1 hypothetical protein SAMN02746091_01336 [Caloramator proteoclasticus DSM 10124]